MKGPENQARFACVSSDKEAVFRAPLQSGIVHKLRVNVQIRLGEQSLVYAKLIKQNRINPEKEGESMKLYYSPGACSLASHIILNEVGTPFETEKMSLANKASVEAVHAKGYVPLLRMDNGEILTEGVVIMQYVADTKPELDLMPKAGTMERYRAMEWLNYISTEIHKGFSPLFAADRLVKDEASRASFKEVVKDNLRKRFAWIETQLQGKDFLMGSKFTAADAYLFTCMSWGKYVAFDTSEWKNLAEWNKRVYQRPAVQKTLKSEGLLS
jgi:glutathione S-transferase